MTTQDEFLAVVADRLRSGLPENPIRPVKRVANPSIAYRLGEGDKIERFKTAASSLGAEIFERNDLQTLLEHIVTDTQTARAVIAEHPQSEPIAAVLSALGVEILQADGANSVARCDLGITGTVAGVALTGSVVIDSSLRGSRLASLLPDHHLALVDKNSIVDTPGEILRGLAGVSLPSNLVFVTGPSRSADIELELTIGVHGPRRLFIALI